MSRFKCNQVENELIFTVEGVQRDFTISFSSEEEAAMQKPEIRELMWALERSWKNSDKK
ncbi:hypothetical protein [Pectobacterium odoriferum]|uniref:hypothetical protein n=1 Tax=Pectobacterium odoriferum TaxID=78398 RepID=UPI000A7CEC08|nr:hypothetical protein [Pectobacterium odoriferum]